MRLIEKLWGGESGAHRVGRAALIPLELLYRSAMAVRGNLFDRGILSVTPSPIAVISVGNLTVGGTGKTPVSAWLADRLIKRGRKPAIVLRGYGDDEPLVHARLNPGISVVVDKERSRGIAKAAAGGADVAILDDAFQHRGAGRNLDIVLLSADDWTGRQHVLPAGPYRESASELRRASMVFITAKAASAESTMRVADWVRTLSKELPIAVIRLSHTELVREAPAGGKESLDVLQGKRVLAIAAVGNTSAFFRQLESAGANVIRLRFRDHHAFNPEDVRKAMSLAPGVDYVICTLKDAVKLAPLWPVTGTPLWYVSLSVNVESGGAAIDEMLERLPWRDR